MVYGCAYYTHVRLEDRHFIVEFNSDGDVLRIKERKSKPLGGVYQKSYWTASSHPLGSSNTLPRRIIAAARAKITAEDHAHNATP